MNNGLLIQQGMDVAMPYPLLGGITGIAVPHQLDISRDGLVLLLDAGDSRSYPLTGTQWLNISGGGGGASLVNGPFYEGGSGGSIRFDGINDYASAPIAILSSNFTLEIAFRVNAGTTSFRDLAVLDNGATQLLLEIGGNNGVPFTDGFLRYYGFGDLTSNQLASQGQFARDSRIHVSAITVNSGLAASYFDGNFQGAGIMSPGLLRLTRLVLAADLLRPSRNLPCNIYRASLYSRGLTSIEVQRNFNAVRGRLGI